MSKLSVNLRYNFSRQWGLQWLQRSRYNLGVSEDKVACGWLGDGHIMQNYFAVFLDVSLKQRDVCHVFA